MENNNIQTENMEFDPVCQTVEKKAGGLACFVPNVEQTKCKRKRMDLYCLWKRQRRRK